MGEKPDAAPATTQTNQHTNFQILSLYQGEGKMEPPHLKLVILQGPRKGETLGFEPGKVVRIGRIVRNNTFSIKDAGISSNHLSILVESAKWVLRDLDSSNGTFLNGSKIPSNSPVDLHHGDTIKIGELTSIQVDLQAQEGSCLRRNPRRQATGKANGTLRVKLEGESSEAVVVEPVEKKRGNPRRGRGMKSEVGEEFNKVQFPNIDETVEVGSELKDVVPMQVKVEPPVNRRATRNSKKKQQQQQQSVVGTSNSSNVTNSTGNSGLKSGVGDEFSKVQLQSIDENVEVDNELENVVPLQEEAELPVNKRATRNSKKQQQQSVIGTSNSSIVTNIIDNPGLKCTGEKIVEKKTRAGARRRKLQEETALCDQVAISEDMVQEARENTEVNQNPGVKKSFVEDESKKDCGSYKEACSNKREGEEACSSQRKDSNENGDWPDLDKLTLGEWFDFLEVHLPKQIIDATEEMIDSMKEKAERVRDYMAKQRNDKGTLPVG